LKEWFLNDKVYLTADGIYFHRCPVCRGDVLNVVPKEEAENAKQAKEGNPLSSVNPIISH